MRNHRAAAIAAAAERQQQGAPPGADPRGLMDAQDVAEMLQVPRSWVYAEARAGRMPHVTLGRYRRFRPAAIEEYIDHQEHGRPRAA
jgi:excisionase family DNA binding protein